MYLREMGGVELLSREGEIAIAKRIEAGKNVMLEALSQSPITANQIKDWNEKLNKNEILVREIIDIDTNYMEDDEGAADLKKMMKQKMKYLDQMKIRKMMNSIQHLLQWKKKLNRKF